MGQCNSTVEGIQQPSPSAPSSPAEAYKRALEAKTKSALRSSVSTPNVPRGDAAAPVSRGTYPGTDARPALQLGTEQEQHASSSGGSTLDRPMQSLHGAGKALLHGGGDLAVSRSPHSILKVGGKKSGGALILRPGEALGDVHGGVHLPPLPGDGTHGEATTSGALHAVAAKSRVRLPGDPGAGEEGSPHHQEGHSQPRGSRVKLSEPEGAPEAEARVTPTQKPSGRQPVDTSKLWVFEETEDVANYYSFGKVLGQGQFGTTRLVTELATGEQYACKSISKKKLKRRDEVEDVKREVQILHHLEGHPTVIRIKGVYEDRRHVHIVMELAAGGELFERMTKRGRYTEKEAAAVFRTMVAVVVHCHNMGVIHRDLKPENFLLMGDHNDAQLKATDFGLSTFFREGQKFRDIVGSALYVAPEVLKRDYSKEADIWSLGVILYILLSGSPPFMAETEEKVFRKVLRSPVDLRNKPWPLVSEQAKDCVRCMLERDPQKRATAKDILNHPWVKVDGVAPDEPIQFEVLTRLQGFSAMNNLKKEAVKIIASLLPEDEIMGLREIFKSIDTDNSGAISIAELREGLLKKGTVIPDDQLQRLVEYVDVNGNGSLDYDEFIAATLNQSKIEQDAYLLRAFQQFDADGSGYISREELVDALKKHSTHTLAEVDEILRQVDQDGDGHIDYEEFCIMMRSETDHMALDDEDIAAADEPDGATDGAGAGVGAKAGPSSGQGTAAAAGGDAENAPSSSAGAGMQGEEGTSQKSRSRKLTRQTSDFVRPSWSNHGGSKGEHVMEVTMDLDVLLQRSSLIRAIDKSKRKGSLEGHRLSEGVQGVIREEEEGEGSEGDGAAASPDQAAAAGSG